MKLLPTGIENFKTMIDKSAYYVDKTNFIEDVLNEQGVSYTRPRRFGKTLNMSMLYYFFSIKEKENAYLFDGLNITKNKDALKHQNKYPTIFISLKEMKNLTFDAQISSFSNVIYELLEKNLEILSSDQLSDTTKDILNKLHNRSSSVEDLKISLRVITNALYTYYQQKVIVLIDEYDVPLQAAYQNNYYEEMVEFLRSVFSSALKTNDALEKGVMTGCLRISKESIFTGLNNFTAYSVLNNISSESFGFTELEVKQLLKDYNLSEKMGEVKKWYDGYQFGNKEIYNPWSVINYISKGCIPQAYWVNTGKNEIFEEIMNAATDDIVEKLHILLQGEIVIARIDQNVVYRSLAEDPANIYSLLLVAGYLKTQKKDLQADGSYLCEVTIPNKEIASVYKSEILSHFLQKGIITRTTANKIAESLYANDHKKLQSAVAEYLDKSISFYDGGAEGFYHGLMLGLIALMDNQYKIKSNRESGDGRYDICMIPREKRYPGILFELKWEKNLEEEDLNLLAEEALQQITTLKYDADMREDGITDILRFGIAFSGKKVRVKTII